MATKKWFRENLEKAQESFDFRLEKILIEVGEGIAFFMEKEKLSRSQMADRLGVNRAYITKILNGHPNLTIKTLLKLSDVLGQELRIGFKTQQTFLTQQMAIIPSPYFPTFEDFLEHTDYTKHYVAKMTPAKTQTIKTQNAGGGSRKITNDCSIAA